MAVRWNGVKWPIPIIFVAMGQIALALRQVSQGSGATFEVRTVGNPAAAVTAIRQVVREVDGNLPLSNVRTQIEEAN